MALQSQKKSNRTPLPLRALYCVYPFSIVSTDSLPSPPSATVCDHRSEIGITLVVPCTMHGAGVNRSISGVIASQGQARLQGSESMQEPARGRGHSLCTLLQLQHSNRRSGQGYSVPSISQILLSSVRIDGPDPDYSMTTICRANKPWKDNN